jgi:hypothetical protein
MALKLTFNVREITVPYGRFLLANGGVDRRYDNSVMPVQVDAAGSMPEMHGTHAKVRPGSGRRLQSLAPCPQGMGLRECMLGGLVTLGRPSRRLS